MGVFPGNAAWERNLLDLLRGCRERAGRRIRVKCARVGSVEYCLYQYKVADWVSFYRYPCLAYARGTVVVDSDVIILPFTKFFNINETPDTNLQKLPNQAVTACEKLDGTLVVLWRDPATSELRGNTRGLLWNMKPRTPPDPSGQTINPYIKGLLRYARENKLLNTLDSLVKDNTAVMFELVVPGKPASRANIDGTIDEYTTLSETKGIPYLLAKRNLATGELIPAKPEEWPLTPKCINKPKTVELLEYVGEYLGEGFVAWYESIKYEPPLDKLDPLVKFKSKLYMLKVSGIQTNRGLVAYALREGIDDLRPILNPEKLETVEKIVEEYNKLQLLIEKANPYAKKLKGYGLRGWLLQAVEDPSKTLGLFLTNGPRKLDSMPGYLSRARRKLEKIMEKAGISNTN